VADFTSCWLQDSVLSLLAREFQTSCRDFDFLPVEDFGPCVPSSLLYEFSESMQSELAFFRFAVSQVNVLG